MAFLSNLTADALNTQEPQRTNNMQLVIMNAPGAGSASNDLALAAESFPIPGNHNSVITLSLFNEVRHYAGRPTYGDMTVAFKGLVPTDVQVHLMNWRLLVSNPSNGYVGFALYGSTGYKRNGYIVEFDSNMVMRSQWDLHGIWPSSVEPGSYNAAGDDMVLVQATFMIDKVVKAPTAGVEPGNYQSVGS